MKKILVAVALSLFVTALVASSSLAGDDEAIRQAVTKSYPNLNVGEIRATAIPGLYEPEIGANILYFFPEKELAIFGEIWTKEGKSITAGRREELAAKKVEDIPLDKGIKIGSGATVVIEFTDPDCPYCRTASAYLKGKKEITRYVYFYPLPMHKDAENHARYVLCSSDKTKAYEEVMSGKHDGHKVDTCTDERVSALMKEHRELAAKAGVSGTPSFWINGHFVAGANIPVIETMLKHQKNLN
jgi:thiol:disulfide interchange protein DsbC